MAACSLAVGIVMLLGVGMAWTTIGPIRSGIVFAAICIVCIFIAKSDKQHPKLGTAAMIINMIAAIINGIIGFSYMF